MVTLIKILVKIIKAMIALGKFGLLDDAVSALEEYASQLDDRN